MSSINHSSCPLHGLAQHGRLVTTAAGLQYAYLELKRVSGGETSTIWQSEPLAIEVGPLP